MELCAVLVLASAVVSHSVRWLPRIETTVEIGCLVTSPETENIFERILCTRKTVVFKLWSEHCEWSVADNAQTRAVDCHVASSHAPPTQVSSSPDNSGATGAIYSHKSRGAGRFRTVTACVNIRIC